jgi:uncharacterized Tic20 family protein
MNIDNVNAEINSNVLDLETLQQQFNTTLQNYSNAYTNYLNSLPSVSDPSGLVSGYDISNVEYIFLQGRMITQTNGQLISTIDLSNSDISGCQAICQSLSNCTGASFDSRSGKCMSYSGEYAVTNGPETYTAIIPLSTQLLSQLKIYNSQLIDLNNQILSTLKNTQPDLDEEIRMNNVAQVRALGFKEKLLIEELEIIALLKEQDKYVQDKNDSYKVVNSYYTQYKMSIFIIIILVVLSLVIFAGTKSKVFIITLILSMFFIFKFNILYVILVLVLFKLYELNATNKVTKMPYPNSNTSTNSK